MIRLSIKVQLQNRKIGSKTRKIFVPDAEEMKEIKDLLHKNPFFQRKFPEYIQGFVIGRNIVSNATYHLNYKITLSIDLQNFFYSVHLGLFPNLPKNFQICFPKFEGKHRAMQGIPTSPFFANLAFLPWDEKLRNQLSREIFINEKWAYTRYADDISISFDDSLKIGKILKIIRDIVKKSPFTLNEKKTKIFHQNSGLRMICGIGVDNSLHVPRRIRKKLRAANHQSNSKSIAGLESFMKLKKPNELKTKMKEFSRKYKMKVFYRNNRLTFLNYRKIKEIPDWIKKFKHLKILNFSRCDIESVGEFFFDFLIKQSIDSLLICNHYNDRIKFDKNHNIISLNLSNTSIKELPFTINKLVFLQNLHLNNTKLTSLPESIGDLKNLKFLDLRETSITSLPYSFICLLKNSNFNAFYMANSSENRIFRDQKGNIVMLNLNSLNELPIWIGELPHLKDFKYNVEKIYKRPELRNHGWKTYFQYSYYEIIEKVKEISEFPSKLYLERLLIDFPPDGMKLLENHLGSLHPVICWILNSLKVKINSNFDILM